ncbi:heterokaryon incompatibility protein-domain-containing protein [Xylariaceae sp. AK1471]|nr:heterokaryon incompatibility protein-domain-containing protein [Xylariaceae sp. AK1471]
MYCDICMSAFKTWPVESYICSPHHASFQSLRDSAQLGCLLCDKLLRILPDGDYFEIPGEPAPCTEYRERAFNPIGYFEVLFCPGWLDNRLPKDYTQKGIGVSYSPVPVKAEEIRAETNLRAGAETWETAWDKQSVTSLFGVNTGSDQSWTLIQHWVARCDQHHQTCKGATDAPWFPTRLIYVGKGTEDPRLYIPDVASWNPNERYTTLSHCWGSDSSQVTKLVTDNLDTLQQKIQIDKLPQTFKDAINITRRLGLRFLWIDSLCIIQGDDEDWAREAANMGMVYANTYLNISATSARNSYQGCYVSRDPAKVAGLPVARIHSDSDRTSWFKFVYSGIWIQNVDQAPLHQRGWVLQERLLSPRVLHFSADQVFWECRENYACETFPESVPLVFRGVGFLKDVYLRDFVPRKPAAFYGEYEEYMETELWSKVVETYSQAQLTFQKDKLIALSGISREIEHLLRSTYVAGLWRCHLPYSLLWTAKSSGYRSTEYLAPSWSWASVEGPISFPDGMREVFKLVNQRGECATLLDVGIDLVTPSNPFGQVKSGWIRVRGRVGIASWEWTESEHSWTEETPVSLTNYVPPFQAYAEVNNPKEFHLVPENDSFTTLVSIHLDDTRGIPCQQAFFLPIYKQSGDSVDGLLLQLLPAGQFVRIGKLCFTDDRMETILASFEDRDVFII